MITAIRSETRPSTSVNFYAWNGPSTLSTYIAQNFTGMVLSRSYEISTDLLSMTHTMVFADQSARTAWDSDPVVASNVSDRRAHNLANGITETLSTVEQ